MTQLPPPSTMSTRTTSIPPGRALLDNTAPEKTFELPGMQLSQICAPTQSCREPQLLHLPPVRHIAAPSILFQSITDDDEDATMPQSGGAEDEYTLSAYGDISLGEVIVPPLPSPTRSNPGPLQPRMSQPRLRLKVQRPPMPGRRNFYVSNPMPHTGGIESGEGWSGSPRPIVNSPLRTQHQPLVTPLPIDPRSSRTQGIKPVEKNGSSFEKLCDELLPRLPSIQLSPPGSPASQALGLLQEADEQNKGAQHGRNQLKADDATKVAQSLPAPAPRQDKPKPTPWRTRLPPRLPIPKWDM